MMSNPLSTIELASQNIDTLSEEQDEYKGQQFLQFTLLPNTNVLLSLEQMVEVLSVPIPQIVPIPQLPEWVMGIYNWQGQILWLVDLGRLIGLSPIYEKVTVNYSAIVIKQKGKPNNLGLLVHRVEDIEWVNPDLIESPPASEVSTELLPFLRGFLPSSNDNIMVILDSESIFAAMPQSE